MKCKLKQNKCHYIHFLFCIEMEINKHTVIQSIPIINLLWIFWRHVYKDWERGGEEGSLFWSSQKSTFMLQRVSWACGSLRYCCFQLKVMVKPFPLHLHHANDRKYLIQVLYGNIFPLWFYGKKNFPYVLTLNPLSNFSHLFLRGF